jgi:outer membrane protein TolC
MKKTLILSSILMLSFNTMAINQTEMIERLKKVHPFFTQQEFDKQSSKLNYIATTANQDWILTGSLDSSNQAGTQTSKSSIGAVHNLVELGADVAINNTWNDGVITDIFSVNYTQPLLKGSGGINDKLESDLSLIQIDINNLKRTQLAENFILSQLFKLVDLSFAQQQLALTTQRLELAKQELTLVKVKFAQSMVDQIDVFLEEDAYQRSLQQQLQAEQTLDLLKAELSIVLEIKPKFIHSDYNLYKKYQFNLGNLRTYLSSNTTEMKILKLEQNLLQRQLLSDKNNTQVQLDLKLGVSNANDNDWNIGLELSHPLGDTRAKSILEKTHISLDKIKETSEEQLINLNIEASVLKKELGHLTKLLDSYKTRIKIAKSRNLAEKKRYELGNSQISFVISAQNNVHEVYLAYAQVAVNYQKSLLKFKAVLDKLL